MILHYHSFYCGSVVYCMPSQIYSPTERSTLSSMKC